MTDSTDHGIHHQGDGPTSSPTPWTGVGVGLLAASVALIVGEMAAALLPGARSPVVSVGSAIVPVVPPAVTDAAIRLLGTADKAVLLGSIVTVVAGAAAGLGVLARRHRRRATAGVVGVGGLALTAAAVDPAAAGVASLAPAALAAAAGVASLWWLTRPRLHDAADTAPSDRRTLLRTAAVVGGTAVLGGGVGRWLIAHATALPGGGTGTLVRATRPLPAVPPQASPAVDGLAPFMTPVPDFYRIDTALDIPDVRIDQWRLRVTGMVDRPLELTYDQLLEYGVVEADITLVCVSNEVGGDLVGTARWRGVRMADVLADAGVQPGANQLVGRAVDGFTTGAPLRTVLDGRESLIAIGMNGMPLRGVHGYPARLIVPGLYGYVSATKWVTELELTTFDSFDAYWIPKGWARRAPVKTQSRIDVPRDLSTIPPGRVTVAGVAWAPTLGISRVEVRVDNGAWQPARLADEVNLDTWRQWTFKWNATPGLHSLRVRATDGSGASQIAKRASARPDGATGYHRVLITVDDEANAAAPPVDRQGI